MAFRNCKRQMSPVLKPKNALLNPSGG
jgi:hypothetical protein